MREINLKKLLLTTASFIITINCRGDVFAQNKSVAEEVVFTSQNNNLFIPSALQNTPDYEIEIVSPKNIVEKEVIKTETSTSPSIKKQVIVKKNDTLYSIATSENMKVADLAEFNKIAPPYTLKIGQKISIPNTEKRIIHK